MLNIQEKEGASIYRVVFWVVAWFSLNISITLLNKTVFQILDFPFPNILTAIHMASGLIGSAFTIYGPPRLIEPAKLDDKGNKLMIAFSFLFTINIVAGNTSLRYVSVSFNQIMRSTVPAICMFTEWLLFSKSYSLTRKLAVCPLILGVAIACYGDIEFTTFGFCVTCFCVLMASSKAIISGRALTGQYKLHPIDLLFRMTPYALFQSCIYAFIFGEFNELMLKWDTYTQYQWGLILLTGFISFFLNIASFYLNMVTSPLTLTISGNAKQALVIILSVAIFGTPINTVNAFGILIVLLGSMNYSRVGYQEKHKSTEAKSQASASV